MAGTDISGSSRDELGKGLSTKRATSVKGAASLNSMHESARIDLNDAPAEQPGRDGLLS